jgi:hypothetical protein
MVIAWIFYDFWRKSEACVDIYMAVKNFRRDEKKLISQKIRDDIEKNDSGNTIGGIPGKGCTEHTEILTRGLIGRDGCHRGHREHRDMVTLAV